MELPDLKRLADQLHVAAEVAKATNRLIKRLLPILKKVPWRTLVRGFVSASNRTLAALREALTLPRPWPRAKLAFKFSLTVATYLMTILSALLTLAYCIQLNSTHLPPFRVAEAVSVLALMAVGTFMQFVQAENLCSLIAKNSRVLGKKKAP